MFDINDWRYDETEKDYSLTIDLCALLGQHCPEDHNNNSIINWVKENHRTNALGTVLLWYEESDFQYDTKADSVTFICGYEADAIHLSNVLTDYLSSLDPLPLEVLRMKMGTWESKRVQMEWDRFIEVDQNTQQLVLFWFDAKFAKWRAHYITTDNLTPFGIVKMAVRLLN